MKNKMDKNYWESRYENNQTEWDIGDISTPLKEYIDQIEDKTLKILIPGVGNGYEFDYLIHQGFKNVYVIDIAKQPIENLKSKHPTLPNLYFICDDFFRLNQKFDLILEQTFFCALDPNLRTIYVEKTHDLLTPNGRLVGLLFDFPLIKEGPPFGGCLKDYQGLFENLFNFQTFEKSYNSIKPRAEKEFFINFKRKNNP